MADEATPEPELTEEEAAELVLSPRARRIVRTVLGTVGLVLGVIVCELVVRVAAPQQLILFRPDLWQPADTVGWVHRPDIDITVNTGERPVSVFTDGEGFRVGPDGPVEEGREVLLLGDSYMEALQVEYEQSTSGLLESKLPEMVGGPVAVRNAAVGGWDVDQHLLRARTLMAQRDYEVVVTALYVGNDIISSKREYLSPREPDHRYRLRFPRAFTFREFTDAFLRPANDFMEVRSHLFLFFKNRLQTVRMKMGLAVLTFPAPFLKAEADTERWEVTAELCREINELAQEHGAEALFVLIPAQVQIDEAALAGYVEGYDLDPQSIDLEQPNRRLAADLAARGITLYDPLPEYRSAQEGGERLYGLVDRHFTLEGNELFASLVAPMVAELLDARAEQEGGAGR